MSARLRLGFVRGRTRPPYLYDVSNSKSHRSPTPPRIEAAFPKNHPISQPAHSQFIVH